MNKTTSAGSYPLTKEYFLDCVSEGNLLPPKSTLFYPKLPTGLVIQYLHE